MITCSIIIRSYNEELHIGKLLDGINKQVLSSDIKVEIILVDSGSTDNTVKISKLYNVTIVSIAKEEFSFGRALNKGINQATGDIIILASAHVYPLFSNWIEKLIAPFQNENVALVYGRQVGNEVTKFSEHQVFKKWFPRIGNKEQLTPFCNNANCAIRKTLWNKIPYDEQLTGLEDIDWAYKVLKENFTIVYEANAVIVHVHEESYLKIKNRYEREAIALKKIIPNVRFTFFDFIRLLISNIFSDIIESIRHGLFFKEFINILKFRLMQFYGTYQGYKIKGEITGELKNQFYYPNGLKGKLLPEIVDEEQDKLIVY